MTDIFLSYSSKDRERVRLLHDALKTARYDVFWDQHTSAGVDWNQSIMARLDRAKLVVVLWSTSSVKSPPVIHEATVARDENKLVPCLLDELRSRDFPLGMYTTQAAKLHDWHWQAGHQGYADLMAAVRSRLYGKSAEFGEHSDEVPEIADLRRRAYAGDASAQANLGQRYRDGEGVPKDERESVRLSQLASDQGYRFAHYNLALAYSVGIGVEKDERQAARLYLLAADQGSVEAQYNLGTIYKLGRGVEVDEREAARFYKLAADKGHKHAQYCLGLMHANGAGGLKVDEVEAMRLWKLAARGGSKAAQEYLQKSGQDW